MTAPTPERPLDVGVLLATYRIISRQVGLSDEARRDVEEIVAALERIPELERRIGDKNFELIGVHEALRKETERAERLAVERDAWRQIARAEQELRRASWDSPPALRIKAKDDIAKAGAVLSDLRTKDERAAREARAALTTEVQPDHATNTYGLIQQAAAPAEPPSLEEVAAAIVENYGSAIRKLDDGEECCPFCEGSHPDPASRPWAAWVGSASDGDGQPTQIIVAPTEGGHVSESDAEWLRRLMRAAAPAPGEVKGHG